MDQLVSLITLAAWFHFLLLRQGLPLLRSVALGGPSMDSSDLGLEDRVDETVAGQHVLALKLRGDDHCLESLTTAT